MSPEEIAAYVEAHPELVEHPVADVGSGAAVDRPVFANGALISRAATRWALLPDAPGNAVPYGTPDAPTEDRVLPPGALPASQLHDARTAPSWRAASWRANALDTLALGGVPDGVWRVGSSVGKNLYIGPPRPYGVDVGRMDSPELAAFVVEAVNERDRYRRRLEDFARWDGVHPDLAAAAREALDGGP